MEKKSDITEQKVDFAHPISVRENADKRQKSVKEQRESLAARLRAGDRAAAEKLVDMYNERIYLYMRRLGHNRQVSEDLTQESFLLAWQHISQLRDGKALNSWMYRIAGNVSKLYWRRLKGRETTSIEEIGVDTPEDGEAVYNKIGNSEQLGRLRNAVARLPEKLRQVVVLHYLEHLTIAEAAEAAGIREGTFKSRLNRALMALRKEDI
jgi:RNA polymerase sigma-70 factor (ECF subfamily)